MLKLFNQTTNKKKLGLLTSELPTIIEHIPGKPSVCNNGLKCCCIACHNPKCMKFDREELLMSNEKLKEHPVNLEDTVCPLNAIIWETENSTPSIVPERCINCGICAKRCPVGAIYSDGEKAIINNEGGNIIFVDLNKDNEKKQFEQITSLALKKHIGFFNMYSKELVEYIYGKLEMQQTTAQFPNIIVRNLFLTIGNKCIISRSGDSYFRIDGLAESNGSENIILLEIEFKKDSLESPRAILDDIAVLVSRYKVLKDQINPFIISFELPNLRTEYWRVIKDIKEVLGIKIKSLTLGALIILGWDFNDTDLEKLDFYADIDSPKLPAFKNIKDINLAIFSPKK